MAAAADKRAGRIDTLYQRALSGKYSKFGLFSFTELVGDAMAIGVGRKTAESYADAVINRLKKQKLLK